MGQNTKFGRGNENPQFTIVDSLDPGRFFFAPEILDKSLREQVNIFQGHHINPNSLTVAGMGADGDLRSRDVKNFFNALGNRFDPSDADIADFRCVSEIRAQANLQSADEAILGLSKRTSA